MLRPISENLAAVQSRLEAAARAAGRPASGITLLAVSKTQPASAVRAAFEAGARHFGENYLQDAVDKVSELADLPITWHYIGRIQSNKTRPIAELFDWVHTVDRLKIARRLSEARAALPERPPLNVCLQVNIDADPAKGGVDPAKVDSLATEMKALPGLRLRGLMTILDPASEPEQSYGELAQLAQPALRDGRWDTLSMGMSGDFEAAISAGSTIVRVGTALFGPRLPTTDRVCA